LLRGCGGGGSGSGALISPRLVLPGFYATAIALVWVTPSDTGRSQGPSKNKQQQQQHNKSQARPLVRLIKMNWNKSCVCCINARRAQSRRPLLLPLFVCVCVAAARTPRSGSLHSRALLP